MGPKAEALFVWSTGHGERWGNTPPDVSEPVLELSLHRHSDRLRPSESHPEHEAAMRSPLPSTLRVLRLDNCRIRTFPQYLPTEIVELYASACDFFTLPDLSAYRHLIVLEMYDNRIERINAPLPPELARINLRQNALEMIAHPPIVVKPETLTSIDLSHNPEFERRAASAPEWARPIRRLVPVRRPFDDGQVRRRGPPTGPPPVQPNRDNVYTNTQNVHESGIQTSAKANLIYIANYSPTSRVKTIQETLASIRTHITRQYTARWLRVITGGFLSSLTAMRVDRELRIRTIGDGNAYVMHGFTPAQIVERLWTRILAEEGASRPELIKRFAEEVLSSSSVCTNGFMTRMANVLIGFDSAVTMRLSPERIMQQRVPATLTRLRKALGITEDAVAPWEFWRDATVQTWNDMEDVELPVVDRREWLEPLVDEMLETLVAGLTRENQVGTESDKAAVEERIRSVGLAKPSAANRPLESFMFELMWPAVRFRHSASN